MKYIIATNLLVLAILFVCGLCQDLEQDLDSKSYDDATSASNSEAVKEITDEKLVDLVSVNVPSRSLGFVHGFVASFSVIIVSELGDKTFFIAAIMAMQHARCLVFTGAISALAFMTVLSVFLGFATVIIPRTVTYYAGTALLAIFGVKMLYDGYKMSPDEGKEELEAVNEELNKANEEEDVEKGVVTSTPPLRRRIWCLLWCFRLCPAVIIQSFTLTFFAEWGDRSQITTIILAAREDPYGVTIGGTIGHAICTAIAVIGGKLIAQKISVKTVTIVGGLVFLLFSCTALLHDPNSEQL